MMNSKCLIVIVNTFTIVLSAVLMEPEGVDKYPNLGLMVTAPENKSERILWNEVKSSLINHVNFNISLPTILYSYGYTDDFDDARTMMEAFQLRGGFNFLVVDWSDYNHDKYLKNAKSVNVIANIYGDALFEVADYVNNFQDWHFIGHSLGAHMVGFVARRINELSNGTILIQRLTGLDPAGPRFFDFIGSIVHSAHLQKTDAAFVDVIHSDAIYFGTLQSIGHVDFWPNTGRAQPGCPSHPPILHSSPEGNCNHQRARLFYIESVATTSVKAFPSIRCENGRNCFSDYTFMGFNVDPSAAQGDYYCTTTDSSPFSKGESGIGFV